MQIFKKIAIILFILSLFTNISFAETLQPVSCDTKLILSKVQDIDLVANSKNTYIFQINSEAVMPNMLFQIDFKGDLTKEEKLCLQTELKNNFTWEIFIEYWDGGEKGVNKILESKLGAQRKGLATGDYWTYKEENVGSTLNITPDKLSDKYGGGIGFVKVTSNFHNNLSDEKPLAINAPSEVSKLAVRKRLGEMKYQILGYLESRFEQYKDNLPLLNCGNSDCTESDGGFGLMQITDCIGAAGTLSKIKSKDDSNTHGFPSYKQIWDWNANIDAGKSCFDIKIDNYCYDKPGESNEQLYCGYKSYNGSSSYGDSGMEVLQEIRKGKFRTDWY
jgi:hypothetical protein